MLVIFLTSALMAVTACVCFSIDVITMRRDLTCILSDLYNNKLYDNEVFLV